MNYFLDLVAELITSPVSAMREITNGERLREGFLIWIFSVLIISLSVMHGSGGAVAGFILTAVLMGLSLIAYSAIIDYIAGFAGGTGTAKGITAAFMASSIPEVFQAVLALLSVAGVQFLEGIGLFVIFIWSFVLEVIAISENYHFTKGKSFLIAIAPAIILLAAGILIFGCFAALAVTGLMNMGPAEEYGQMFMGF
jgi:hypothetical protein